jgi:hypothetical protein
MTRTVLAAWLVASLAAPPVYGQTELGTVLKKHYKLRFVSCNSCHIKEADEEAEMTRDKLTPFGDVIGKLVAGRRITERLNAVKGMEEEEEEVKDANGRTYAELIRAGEIDGLKPGE